jgi:hypothetical protein
MNIVTEKICKPSSIKDSAPTNEEVGLASSSSLHRSRQLLVRVLHLSRCRMEGSPQQLLLRQAHSRPLWEADL